MVNFVAECPKGIEKDEVKRFILEPSRTRHPAKWSDIYSERIMLVEASSLWAALFPSQPLQPWMFATLSEDTEHRFTGATGV